MREARISNYQQIWIIIAIFEAFITFNGDYTYLVIINIFTEFISFTVTYDTWSKMGRLIGKTRRLIIKIVRETLKTRFYWSLNKTNFMMQSKNIEININFQNAKKVKSQKRNFFQKLKIWLCSESLSQHYKKIYVLYVKLKVYNVIK